MTLFTSLLEHLKTGTLEHWKGEECKLKKTPKEEAEAVFSRWLNGETYMQISNACDIGIGTISRIIEAKRKEEPDLDRLRKLNLKLKIAGLTVNDAVRACRLLEELNRLGLGPDELEHYIRLNKDHPSEVIACAVKLTKMEQDEGKSCEQILKDYERAVSGTAETRAMQAKLKEENEASERAIQRSRMKTGGLIRTGTGSRLRLKRKWPHIRGYEISD